MYVFVEINIETNKGEKSEYGETEIQNEAKQWGTMQFLESQTNWL